MGKRARISLLCAAGAFLCGLVGIADGTTLKPWPLVQIPQRYEPMNNIIYLVGLVVVILAVLAFFGLR
jgi:hypothetical protein